MKYRLLNLTTAISSVSIAIAFLTITPQSIAAREWSEIVSQGELKVAVKNNLRPLGFTQENGNLAGLEIDIAHKLAAELLGDPAAIAFLPVKNQERLQVVLKEEVDIAIARVAVTTSRSRIVDFSPYYYLDGTGIVTKNPLIENINSLPLKSIAVLENSATIAVIQYRLPNATLMGVDSYEAALELMETNQVDALSGDHSVLTGLTQEYPHYHLLPERLSGESLAVVMPKGLQYKELRAKVNGAIAGWKESGWLQERIKYWGL
ncbi:MAG: transporter substrate-binding domain-containing protein [Hydrococcus sp. SU_1_0]|nr:transporter substrate-binding domain-containing protein [Hydrococcus sp. SU_1_0]